MVTNLAEIQEQAKDEFREMNDTHILAGIGLVEGVKMGGKQRVDKEEKDRIDFEEDMMAQEEAERHIHWEGTSNERVEIKLSGGILKEVPK